MAIYYEAVSDINVILRPVYNKSSTGEATWRDRDTSTKRTIMAICNLDTARFVST